MTEALPLGTALFFSFLIAIVIFLERLFPFALFSRREPPALIRFIEQYIPSMVIAILIMYCLKDISFSCMPYGLPYFIACASTVLLHLLIKNSMISIFGGTAIFMLLSYLM